MEYEKNMCPVVDVNGVITAGKQFDLDITLPKDNRNVIYGVIKDCYKEPVRDAVVKLIEVICNCGKEERKPVSHTFTDKDGEFVFGPLCPDKFYEIQIWVDQVKHKKICTTCEHKGSCLKGIDIDCKKNDDFKPCEKTNDEYNDYRLDEKKYENHKNYDCKHDDKKYEEHKNCDCKHDDKKCEEHKDYDCKYDDKKYEEHKNCDCKHDDKKCEEHKESECKPCEKKCNEHKEPDYRPYPLRPFSYRR